MVDLNNVNGNILLFLTSAKKYMSSNIDIIKYYVNKEDHFCVYLTVNRPYTSLINIFNKEKINTEKIFIIDGVTPVNEDLDRSGNVVFIGSPHGLTDMSIAITSALKSLPKNKRMLFLDSVSTLVIYNSLGTITKFTHFLINKMRTWHVKGIIISLEKETDEKLLGQLSQFCDDTIEVK